MAETAACRLADDLAVFQDRFDAEQGRKPIDREQAEKLLRTVVSHVEERVSADEVLAEIDRPIQSGRERIVIGADLGRPIDITLLQAAGLDRPVSNIAKSVRL